MVLNINKNKHHTALLVIFMTCSLSVIWLLIWQYAYAAASVTAATGGTAISADKTGGAYTILTGPTITEGANGDIQAAGTIILTAPAGFVFNTGSSVSATTTRLAGSKACFTFASNKATPTASTITFTANTADGGGGNPVTTCKVDFSNIQVRPSAGTPLASGNITNTGTNAGAPSGATNYGTLTEIVGTKNKLTITTQPSSPNTINTDFSTKPIVTLEDQFGNTVTTDSASAITRTVVLSTQACGGTAGSGTLSSTPANNAAVASGIMNYTAMQYNALESIKLCFTSTGVTSALSNTISVIVPVPTVTTQAGSSIESSTATGNGNITNTGGENNDKRGFVYDTASKSLPGNVAPGSSGYANYAEDAGSFVAGTFTKNLTSLNTGATYYVRAYAHNSTGYAYGGEVSFLTKPAAPTSVAATDGTYTDKVTITWIKATGATDYHVWRDAVDLGATGDVATFNDTGAGAPSITPGTTIAGDGANTAQVDLSLSGTLANNGTTHTYKVVASNATGNSVDSATDTGFRGVGTLSYQWQRSAADSDASYSDIIGATGSTYADNAAPAPTITTGTASAGDGLATNKVTLSISGATTNVGDGRYYKVTLTANGAASQVSTADRGYRGVGTLTYQWNRSSGDADSGYTALSGAITAPFDDTTAPMPSITVGTASASDGTSLTDVALSLSGQSTNIGAGRYFYATLSASGAASQDTNHDRGYINVGTLSYQWQRSAADSDVSYSDIIGATTVNYNDSGAPADGSGRYYKCSLTAAGATMQASAVDRGYRMTPVVSISITANGTIAYGTLPGSASKSTIQLSKTPIVKNNGNVAEDLTIKGQNTACPWTLWPTAGAEKYSHEYSINGGSSWTALTTVGNQNLITNLAVNATQSFDLRITMPTSTGCFGQQSADVTITATQH